MVRLVPLLDEEVARARCQVAAVGRCPPAARTDNHGHVDRLQKGTAGMLLVEPISQRFRGKERHGVALVPAHLLNDDQAGGLCCSLVAPCTDVDLLSLTDVYGDVFRPSELFPSRFALPAD